MDAGAGWYRSEARGSHRRAAPTGLAVLAVLALVVADLTLLVAGARPAAAATPSVIQPAMTFTAGVDANMPMVVGGDGAIWFNAGHRGIGRLAMDGTSKVFVSPVGGGRVSALALGPDGNVWFHTSAGAAGGEAVIARVTPDGAISTVVAYPADVADMVLGPDGNLWLAEATRLVRLSPAGVATPIALPTALQPANSIAVGPDGNLWTTSSGAIGRVTTTGAAASFPAAVPNEITRGPDGAMWFVSGSNAIGRIRMDGTIATFTGTDLGPRGITAGADGNLWFGNYGYGTIGRITPTGTITRFLGPGIDGPWALVAGPDGNVWFSNHVDRTFGRMTPSGEVATFRGPTVSGPWGVTSGPGGQWFTNNADDSIGRVDGAGNVERFTGAGVHSPTEITRGPDGNLWFLNGNPGADAIGRVAPTGAITMFTHAGIRSPTSLVVGADGNVWFANRAVGSIGRLSPTGEVTTFTDPAMDEPDDLVAATDGKVWFRNGSIGVGRIDPNGAISLTTFPFVSGVAQLTGGPDGTMWFLATRDGDTEAYTLTTAGVATQVAPALPIDGVRAFTIGPDGNAWLANDHNELVRLTRAGATTTFHDDRLGGRVRGLAAGADGNLWVAGEQGDVLGTFHFGSPPSVPTMPSAVPGDGRATVQWLRPNDNGSPITGYVVTPYVDGVARSAQTFTATAGTVTGLVNGQRYTFEVVAVNGNGTSPASAATAAVTVGAPATVAGVVASPNDGSATVTWTVPPTNGAAITGYEVTPIVDGEARPAVRFASTARSQVVPGLRNGTAYAFRVAAINANGTGPASLLSASVTVGTPKAAGTVAASPEDGGAKVSLYAPNDNGSPITGYVVTPYLGTNPLPSQTFDASTRVLALTGLRNGQWYSFRIAATNAVGTGPRSAMTPTIVAGAPKMVPLPSAVAGPGSATLSWRAPADNGSPLATFVVAPYADGVAQPELRYGPGTTAPTIAGLAPGVSYTFRVTARNANGSGPTSAPSAPVVPLAPATP